MILPRKVAIIITLITITLDEQHKEIMKQNSIKQDEGNWENRDLETFSKAD